MKYFFLFFCLSALTLVTNAQDLILTSGGKQISCKVINVDETRVWYRSGNDTLRKSIDRKEVFLIKYQEDLMKKNDQVKTQSNIVKEENRFTGIDQSKAAPKYNYSGNNGILTGSGTSLKNSLTIGLLEGGSLVGLDYEYLLGKNVGIQLGAGVVGFDASFNIHFKPSIQSSFLSLQYWHMGVGKTFSASLLGPSLVLRARKIFTGQLGLGFLLKQGPAWNEDTDIPSTILTYAVGIYFPY